MNPAELIAKAEDQGVHLVADGSHLRCKYRSGLPEELKAELVAHKPVLLAYLSGFGDGAMCRIKSPADLPSEWRLEWEERAAIMEYDGGLSRELAEHLALVEIVNQMSAVQKS
jgi:hypothetical protein